MQGKIIKGIGGFYYVHDGIGKVYECRAKGIFRNRGIKPLVGDDVEISVLDEEKATGNLDEILPRKNRLIRPAVSNVDQAVVVFAITDPMPNLNLLDRFLVMMERQEVPVSICFNKIDLVDAAEQEKLRAIYEPAGYPVHFISTYEKSGLEEFHRLIIGKTTVLAGPSGVGKSSITNFIQPEAQMETGGISEKIRRGKHTTRHSELFFVEESTYMMDTPGFSSLYIEDLEPEALKDFFPEFEAYEDECRFLGCVHIGERECGVKTAVQEHKIGQSRYDNYRLMYQELKEVERGRFVYGTDGLRRKRFDRECRTGSEQLFGRDGGCRLQGVGGNRRQRIPQPEDGFPKGRFGCRQAVGQLPCQRIRAYFGLQGHQSK